MRGRKTGQDKRIAKQQDGFSVEDVVHAGLMATNKRGEIAVFDAGKYFAGAGNLRLRIEEMDQEEPEYEDADAAEASGDLPLSPLPEFYTTSNAKRYSRNDKRQQAGDKAHHVYAEARVRNVQPATAKTTGGAAIALPAQKRTVTSIDQLRMPNGDSLPSPPSTASAGHHGVCNQPRPAAPAAVNITNSTSDRVSQSKTSSTKPQPFSPSSRLASFLAKFKLSSSESKSKPSSQYISSATLPTGAAAGMPASKSFYPNAAALPVNGKAPSPRGRFLRALSSSSSHSNSLLKPITHMHQHNSIAASTPVSPAGSVDPYSPITHSASTTPTSRKNPRSRSRSHASNHDGTSPGSRLSLPTTDWRRDLDNSTQNRSLSTPLPFLRRKLKAYLMPEKSPRHHHENHQQGMNSQDKMNIHHVNNGARAEDRQQRAYKVSATAVSDKLQVTSHLPGVDDRQQHTHNVSTASTDKRRADGSAAHTPEQADCKPHHGNTTRSQGRQQATEQSRAKDTRRRGEWRRHAEEMEDDIEVAERLLRVVKEHQSSQTYTSSYKGATSNYRQQSSNGYANYQDNRHAGGEINGSSSRKSRKNLVSPSSSPAANYHSKQTSKEEFACPYDSDSSSDLFEIETLQAFSHVAGLYRPRDLPVYDSNPLKSPLHLK